jgi:hypothetical protein
MNYQKKIKKHLSTYNKEVIGIDENGINGNDGPKKSMNIFYPKGLKN